MTPFVFLQFYWAKTGGLARQVLSSTPIFAVQPALTSLNATISPLSVLSTTPLSPPAGRHQWRASWREASPPEAEVAGMPWGSNNVKGEEEGLPPHDGEALNKGFLIQAGR